MEILDASGPLPDAVLRYDERAEAVVDVFLPDGPADTVVTFVHGGFWRAAYDRGGDAFSQGFGGAGQGFGDLDRGLPGPA